jgi:hypothetical protein
VATQVLATGLPHVVSNTQTCPSSSRQTAPLKADTMPHAFRRVLPILAACWAFNTSAALVTVTGACGVSCEQLGLAPGGTVSASFDLDFAGGANMFVSKASVVSFSVAFGNIAFDNTDLSNWDFRMFTDGAGNVAGLQFLASFGSSFDALGDSLDLRENQWWTSHTAVCSDGLIGTACDFGVAPALGVIGDYQHGTSVVALVEDAQNVPEPASLALFGAALCGLFGAGTLRTRRVSLDGPGTTQIASCRSSALS